MTRETHVEVLLNTRLICNNALAQAVGAHAEHVSEDARNEMQDSLAALDRAHRLIRREQ